MVNGNMYMGRDDTTRSRGNPFVVYFKIQMATWLRIRVEINYHNRPVRASVLVF